MEDFLIGHLPALFRSEHPAWAAGSVPLGAGIPDIIVATYQASVSALATAGGIETNILAYLRVVGRARPETIATRLRLSPKTVEKLVRGLLEAEALTCSANTVGLTPNCRDLLPTVIAIEVKIGNWQRALSQALRNRIFAHRSFVALPCNVAARVQCVPLVLRSGVGVIAIDPAGSATIVKPAAFGRPKVWFYYYQLAALVGQQVGRAE